MIRIPGGTFDFKVQGMEIEGDASPYVDVQYAWEDRHGAFMTIQCRLRRSSSTNTR